MKSPHPGQHGARRRVRLLQPAADESARSVREKDKFLATISHELRQPLNAALAALRLLEIGGAKAETARVITDAVATIESDASARRLTVTHTVPSQPICGR